METSMQAWKYAKGLYLIPLFMIFNEEIILGGPLPLVLWSGFIAIVALAAFAAALEGFLFRPMPLWQRALNRAGASSPVSGPTLWSRSLASPCSSASWP